MSVLVRFMNSRCRPVLLVQVAFIWWGVCFIVLQWVMHFSQKGRREPLTVSLAVTRLTCAAASAPVTAATQTPAVRTRGFSCSSHYYNNTEVMKWWWSRSVNNMPCVCVCGLILTLGEVKASDQVEQVGPVCRHSSTANEERPERRWPKEARIASVSPAPVRKHTSTSPFTPTTDRRQKHQQQVDRDGQICAHGGRESGWVKRGDGGRSVFSCAWFVWCIDCCQVKSKMLFLAAWEEKCVKPSI